MAADVSPILGGGVRPDRLLRPRLRRRSEGGQRCLETFFSTRAAEPVAGIPLRSQDTATDPGALIPDPVLNGSSAGASVGSAVGSAVGLATGSATGSGGALVGATNPGVIPQVLP